MLIFPEEENVFMCLKCGFKTSGRIVPGSTNDRRWCPDCNSPLVKCNHCMKRVSGTIKDSVPCGHCSKLPTDSIGVSEVICDNCKKVVNPEALIIKP